MPQHTQTASDDAARLDAGLDGLDAHPGLADLAHAYEHLPAAVFVVDAAGNRIVHANQAAARITGHTRHRLRGRKASGVFDAPLKGIFASLLTGHRGDSELTGLINTRQNEKTPVSLVIRSLAPLLPSLCLVLAFDISRLQQQLDALGQRVRSDPLTGLLNRTSLDGDLMERIANHDGERSMALLAIDLDHLRAVNDSFGRGCGDDVLTSVADRLHANAPRGSLVARYDSDTFMLLLDDLAPDLLTARDQATEQAERLLAVMRQPHATRSITVSCTGTIGIALFPHQARTAQDLLHNANLGLRRAAATGGDHCRFFSEEDLRELHQQGTLEKALQQNLNARQFDQVWLPLVQVASGRCIGIESLLRGSGALAGVKTSRIIEIAGRQGLLPKLGVLAHGAGSQTYRLLASKRLSPMIEYVGYNVSAQELLSPGYLDALLESMEACGMPFDCLVLELAEDDLIAQRHRLEPILHQLRGSGIRIAIDGFGSESSSIAMLRDLPIDIVKIHRRLIWHVDSSARDREVVRAIIALARSLGISTVAVGVETADQFDILRSLDCDMAQGFLFSRPLPENELPGYLRRHTLRGRR